MSTDSPERTRPNAIEYVLYCYGKRLPDSMRAWVRNDLAGPGAVRRTVVRWSALCVLILIPMLFIPTTLLVHASMTLPILIPFVYFSFALNTVWRRHRLDQHGLDPDIADERKREREAPLRRTYEEKYGPRSR
ncbi:DUF5313 domain-containing protein [Gordonia sp. HY002]|uniref:DUF5313 domain-containing protein n=1 Tax=Gordonia zhenghanii TaxID=2911516 RepID=UPI001EEFAE08|nr:DUF5313 domain-containing protein [Gordonia zhenghanii]MCF8572270.1 DUF5313 domain-containing protein [Gordonia zhenghanii]MCF8608370.1 DUF5313 domain-containing protein [Gordonia zhenghanii]